jgi:hypothetical protein
MAGPPPLDIDIPPEVFRACTRCGHFNQRDFGRTGHFCNQRLSACHNKRVREWRRANRV